MKPDWRTTRCARCGGHGFLGLVGLPDECSTCGGSGRVFIRPNGAVFSYPGGPAVGNYGTDAYADGLPFPNIKEANDA